MFYSFPWRKSQWADRGQLRAGEAGLRAQQVSASLPALLWAHCLLPCLGCSVTLLLALTPCSSWVWKRPMQGLALKEEQVALHCRNIHEKYSNLKKSEKWQHFPLLNSRRISQTSYLWSWRCFPLLLHNTTGSCSEMLLPYLLWLLLGVGPESRVAWAARNAPVCEHLLSSLWGTAI